MVVSCPVGTERLCFDAHRVFHASTVVRLFGDLELTTFALIDDKGEAVQVDASIKVADSCHYGCGIFVFSKPR